MIMTMLYSNDLWELRHTNMLPESFAFIKKNFVCKGKAGAVTKVKLVNQN